MAKIIEFEGSPVHKLKRELEEKNKEIEILRQQIRVTTQRLASVISVNDMLKLQINDMQTNLQYLKYQIKNTENNLIVLKSKLPDLSGLEAALMSIDLRRKFENEQEVNLNPTDTKLSFEIEGENDKPEKPTFNPEIPPKD